MSLKTKYRPTTFDELYGNDKTISTLEGFVAHPPFPNAVLLHGPVGSGKTTTARIIKDTLGCSSTDYREIDTADMRGIDMVRDIIHKAPYKPVNGPVRVWTIDECHQLTTDAQNAFLKLLEEPPDHAYFILCTTDPSGLIPTFKSRCSQLQFAPLDTDEMIRLLRHVVKLEGEQLTDEIYQQIADSSVGLPRNALQILEQVLAVDVDFRLEMIHKAQDEQAQVIDLCRALFGSTNPTKLGALLKGLQNVDPEVIRRTVLSYAKTVLLSSTDPSKMALAALVIDEFYEPFWNVGFAGVVLASYSVFKKANNY